MSENESSQLASKNNEMEKDVTAEGSFGNSLVQSAVNDDQPESSVVVDSSSQTAIGDEKESAASSISGAVQEFSAESSTTASGKKDQSVADEVAGDKESTADDLNQQALKREVMTIINDLESILQDLPGGLKILERLKENLGKAGNLLLRIEDTIRNHQLRKSLRSQEDLNTETSSESSGIEVIADEGSSRMIRVKSRASTSQEDEYISVGRSLELAYVDQVLLAAKLRQRMEEVENELETEEAAACEPDEIAVGVDEEGTEEDDMKLEYPPISGQYTLALAAHKYNPEPSSSDDSQTPESSQCPQQTTGAPQL